MQRSKDVKMQELAGPRFHCETIFSEQYAPTVSTLAIIAVSRESRLSAPFVLIAKSRRSHSRHGTFLGTYWT